MILRKCWGCVQQAQHKCFASVLIPFSLQEVVICEVATHLPLLPTTPGGRPKTYGAVSSEKYKFQCWILSKFCRLTQVTTKPKHMDSTQTQRPLDSHDLDAYESANSITIWNKMRHLFNINCIHIDTHMWRKRCLGSRIKRFLSQTGAIFGMANQPLPTVPQQKNGDRFP